MALNNRQIIAELEDINEQDKNIVKKVDDVKNDWTRLKVKRSWWYIIAEALLAILVCMIGFEIALLITGVDIWHTSGNYRRQDAGLYSMIFALVMTFINLGAYLILIYRGKSDFHYNDVALKNNIVYKETNSISKKSYWLGNFALFVLIVNFFLFYGFVGTINTAGDDGKIKYQTVSAILSVLSIIVPAAAIPLAMQYINKHNADRKVEQKYHDWMRLNATSKYAAIKKIDFKKKINYLDVSNQLGIDKNIIVIDEKSTGKNKENIILYNNIKLSMLKELLRNYSDNVTKRTELYKKLKWKRNKLGRIVLNKSFRNSSLTTKIKRLNRKNDVLISIMWSFYAEKFDY